MNKLENIQEAFLWKNSTPKIKHETLCDENKPGELNDVDIPNKIIAFQCSCIRSLHYIYFHEWKLI